jgi:putative copper export protein
MLLLDLRPEASRMRTLYLVTVGLHLLTAIFWIGGLLFLALAVIPVARQPMFRVLSPAFLEALGPRFQILGWIAMGTLILAGLMNPLARGVTPAPLLDPVFWGGPFGRALAGKLLAVALIVGLNALHDFWAGPRATRALAADPEGAEGARWRRLASWLGRLTLLASLAAMVFSILMVRRWP